jgi:hypothetical protein
MPYAHGLLLPNLQLKDRELLHCMLYIYMYIYPLDYGSARRRGPYLYNTRHLQETIIHASAGFKPAIPISELPQTHAVDRAATGISHSK